MELTSPQPEIGGRILVVDDVPANVRLLAGILKIEGFEVLTAQSGEDALQMARSSTPETAPDVVLLDVMMPGMDGFECCRHLKNSPETASVPVVMVTALRETSDRVRALDAGADDFLTKPVDETEVVARVRSLIRVKRNRDELERAYTDLRNAEAMRDSMAAMLVHDLRTPLTTMMVALELLQSAGVGELNEMQTELTTMCVSGGRNLLAIVNDLLDVAKMESGKIELKIESFDFQKILNEAIEQTKPASTNSSRAGIESVVALDLPPIQADESLIRRVLVNLLGNAVKFSPQNRVVNISAHVDENQNAPALRVSIQDQGQGIAANDLERIFDKFEQGQLRKEGNRLSTGLGLTFCKMVVEAHGGRIWAESSVGEGSTFWMVLPLETIVEEA